MLARCNAGPPPYRKDDPAASTTKPPTFIKARNLCVRVTYGCRGYNRNLDQFYKLFSQFNPGPVPASGMGYIKNPHDSTVVFLVIPAKP